MTAVKPKKALNIQRKERTNVTSSAEHSPQPEIVVPPVQVPTIKDIKGQTSRRDGKKRDRSLLDINNVDLATLGTLTLTGVATSSSL